MRRRLGPVSSRSPAPVPATIGRRRLERPGHEFDRLDPLGHRPVLVRTLGDLSDPTSTGVRGSSAMTRSVTGSPSPAPGGRGAIGMLRP